jgi:hypothetical protein
MNDVTSYLLDIEEIDWSEALSTWGWLLPNELSIWMVNRFGDLFLIADDTSILHLDMGTGSISQLAKDEAQFIELVTDADHANNWFFVPLVDQLVDSGTVLDAKQCYGFKVLPLLGGSYELDNIAVFPTAEYIRTMGHLHEQLKDLPDDAHVELRVVK